MKKQFRSRWSEVNHGFPEAGWAALEGGEGGRRAIGMAVGGRSRIGGRGGKGQSGWAAVSTCGKGGKCLAPHTSNGRPDLPIASASSDMIG